MGVSLKILSITKVIPAPYGDSTRKRPLDIVVEKPNGQTETIRIHETKLDDFGRQIMRLTGGLVPEGTSTSTVLAVLWGLWKVRKRGASMASILNVDIEQ